MKGDVVGEAATITMSGTRGSEWHKWDFHVHTPYSILNNQYEFNPFVNTEQQSTFDDYVRELFTKAVNMDIHAIGITDYFMIEGYKRIKEEYLENETKLSELFPDESFRNQVKHIYVFPNIELRINTFVGDKAHSVNYHVLFDGNLSTTEIEENFLHKLDFDETPSSHKALTLSNIENFGKQMRETTEDTGSDLWIGLKCVTVNSQNVLDVLRNNNAFQGKYFIAIPTDEDLSRISWTGRDSATRKLLYQQATCLFTSNEKTISWALACGEEESRIKEFGSIKPCIWGSDAHSYKDMFAPANDKFCWIKAELSHNGFMQVIYEPAERVRIQKDYPDSKDAHQIISSITIDDERFQTEPILFNEGLNCIIGGKSTGKSVLLRQLALAIDPEYVEKQERGNWNLNARSRLKINKSSVVWKDGTDIAREILYIPQTYLNNTIDSPQDNNTAINKIIRDVLLQEPEIEEAHKELLANVDRIRHLVRKDINEYFVQKRNYKNCCEEIKQKGCSETFRTLIHSLEIERSELASKVNITSEEIALFSELQKKKQYLLIKKRDCAVEKNNYSFGYKPLIIIPGLINYDNGESENLISDFFPVTSNELKNKIQEANEKISVIWDEACELGRKKVSELIENIDNEIHQTEQQIIPLMDKVTRSEQLQKITSQLESEMKHLQEAEERETERKKIENSIKDIKKRILDSQDMYSKAYDEYCGIVRGTGTKKGTQLTFDALRVWKSKEFQILVMSLFDNRNFSSFRSMYNIDLTEEIEDTPGSQLFENIWTALEKPQEFGGLTLKTGNSPENALDRIFFDWNNVHYVVKSEEDTVEEMSPGKKALVLLELLINLKESTCPILIDQPEDDLDNRSIFNDLVRYIRDKKKERQFIVVTHNANIVLGADAEEIIIANQSGRGTENASRRFEYRTGAIEDDSILKDESGNPLQGILYQKGIQTQICDILEGGRSAFDKRKNKYRSVDSFS